MLNKKLCLEHAGLPLDIAPGHPLLRDDSTEYIVRTAIKIIDRHKVLILYFYPREQAARGDFCPLWTMFHGRDDFITLVRTEDGRPKWRTASLENLDGGCFPASCSLLSPTDQQNILRYCGDPDGRGLYPLLFAQCRLQVERRRQREWRKDRQTRERMGRLPALPKGLTPWVGLTAIPSYFFYDYRKGRKVVQGVCTACGHAVEIPGARHNAKGTCPHCGQALTMKSRGRRGRIYDRGTAQIIQRTAPDQFVIRVIKAECRYEGDTPVKSIYENARLFVRFDGSGITDVELYYLDYWDRRWKPGTRPVYYTYTYNYAADVCGHLYCRNLRKVLNGTPWQYCPMDMYYRHDQEPMEVIPFLEGYTTHPRLEHLIKVGFYELASDMVYRGSSSMLDQTQSRTHRILGVDAGDVDFLRSLDVDATGLWTFQDYYKAGLKDRQKLFAWQLDHDVHRDVDQLLERMSVHRFLRYVDGQYSFLRYRKTPSGQLRYGSMQDLVSEYRDYLDMCGKEKYDMSSSFILYPRDVQKSHDKLAHHIKAKADARMRRGFKAAYAAAAGTLDFAYRGLEIVYPSTPDDVVNEGNSLHHCVGGYVDRIARKECLILFLRRSAEPQKPFYTIELRGRDVTQVRGMYNEAPAPRVKQFISRWERAVLRNPGQEAA